MMDVYVNVPNPEKPTPIQAFYKDANVFVTGATGFVGRILVEKLLRSCPDISTIFLLVRNKKGKNLETRLDELFDDVVFGELRKVNPKFRHKVVPIEGDCCLPKFGLKEEDVQTLVGKVSVVFHVAATVRFDEKLGTAVTINVKAPLYLLELAKQMVHLKSFIHISTAFTNCVQPLIEEKIYPPPMEYEELIKIVDNIPENLVNDLTPQIIGEWPNTYAFTKAVAENAVAKNGMGLPIAIFRPSIIISTFKEPIPAWINNIYGPTGVCAGAGVGLLRTLNCDHTVNANIVPVDMCVNAAISASWEVGTNFKKNGEISKQDIPVYNFESSEQPITWGRFMDLNSMYGQKYPTVRAMWFYCLTLWKTKFMYTITKYLFHLLPALLIDIFFMVIGRQPMMLNIYKKIHKFSAVIAYFCTRNFYFKSTKVNEMLGRMTEADREIFFCDLKKLDWDQFFQVYLKGLRIYILQDDLSTVDRALVIWGRFRILHRTLQVICLLCVLRISWFLISYLHGTMST